MANPFRRIFGLGPDRLASRPDEVLYDNGKGVRMLAVDDTTAEGVAARHNFEAIYGEGNVPEMFGRRNVIQVNKDGAWQNVTGMRTQPAQFDAQIAALQSYETTGVIGPQPTNQRGPNTTPSGQIGSASPSSFSSTPGGDPLAMPAAASSLTPEAVAFLNATSVGESGGRYDVRYDGANGSSFALNGQHPRIRVPTDGGLTSDAAGRYQFLSSTWDDITGGNVPFTPENQDIYAWKLAQRDYKARTGRDLQTDLSSNGLTPDIMKTMAPTWSAYGNQKKAGEYQTAYQSALQGYANAPRTGSGPELVGKQANTEAAPFGTLLQPNGSRLDAASPLLSRPTPTSPNASPGLFETPLNVDMQPEAPSLVSRVQTQQAPQLLGPSKNF